MAPTIDTATEFSVAIIPDTQHYSRLDNGIFEAMTQWIADNESTYNIQTVLHEGDLVHNYHQDLTEWDIAETAIDTLDSATIPALLATGNHDGEQGNLRNLSEFRSRFPVSRYDTVATNDSTVVDYGVYNSNPENVYFVQEIHGQSYIFFATEVTPRDEVVSWIDSTLDSYPDAVGFLNTHAYLFHDGTRHEEGDNYHPSDSGWGISDWNDGQLLWQNLIKNRSNVNYVTGGHMINGPYVARRFDESDPGANVNQTFMNYQDIDNGGDGWLRLVIVDTETQDARIRTYSPHLGSWSSDSGEKFDINLVNTMDNNYDTTGTYRTDKLAVDGGSIGLSSDSDWSDAQASINNAEIANGLVRLTAGSSPPASEDLHNHYDATALSLSDGETVSTWADESGNGYDLTATGGPTFVDGSLNGNPVVRYNGTDDYHQVSFSAISQPNTIFVVVDNATMDEDSIVESASDTDRQVLRATSTDGYRQWASSDGGWGDSNDTTQRAIVAALFDGSSSFLRVNGTETSTSIGTNALAGLTLGAQYDGAQNYFDGDIAEVLHYPMDKSGIVTDVESYLSDKWGITV